MFDLLEHKLETAPFLDIVIVLYLFARYIILIIPKPLETQTLVTTILSFLLQLLVPDDTFYISSDSYQYFRRFHQIPEVPTLIMIFVKCFLWVLSPINYSRQFVRF